VRRVSLGPRAIRVTGTKFNQTGLPALDTRHACVRVRANMRSNGIATEKEEGESPVRARVRERNGGRGISGEAERAKARDSTSIKLI
jgi:hypothetical protein